MDSVGEWWEPHFREAVMIVTVMQTCNWVQSLGPNPKIEALNQLEHKNTLKMKLAQIKLKNKHKIKKITIQLSINLIPNQVLIFKKIQVRICNRTKKAGPT